jgi:hypothetical protein
MLVQSIAGTVARCSARCCYGCSLLFGCSCHPVLQHHMIALNPSSLQAAADRVCFDGQIFSSFTDVTATLVLFWSAAETSTATAKHISSYTDLTADSCFSCIDCTDLLTYLKLLGAWGNFLQLCRPCRACPCSWEWGGCVVVRFYGIGEWLHGSG